MAEIHESFEAQDFVNEMIPCICAECSKSNAPHFYKYEVLKLYAEKGRPSIVCDKSIDDVSVDRLLSGIAADKSAQYMQQLGNIQGTLFEQVAEKLLGFLYPLTTIQRAQLLSDHEGGNQEEYEYDFIVTNPRHREIVIVEAKGYYNEKAIKLGTKDTKNTVHWFFGRTLPFAKRVLPNPNNYAVRACYLTTAKFEKDARQFLEEQNRSRLKPSLMDVFYDGEKLNDLLNDLGLTNDLKDLKRYFTRQKS